jgi:plastocyanin
MLRRVPRNRTSTLIVLTALVAIVAIVLITTRRTSEATERSVDARPAMNHAGMNHSSSEEMTEEEMQAWVDAWFAAHPIVGTSAQGTPVVTFRAFSNKFDFDSDMSNTPIDTVVVGVGDIVAWQRLVGAHTVTNGVDSNDPAAGTIFDVPLDSANPVFQHLYDAPGTFPFYCRTHEDFFMQGVVIVVGATPTERTSWGELKVRNRQGR